MLNAYDYTKWSRALLMSVVLAILSACGSGGGSNSNSSLKPTGLNYGETEQSFPVGMAIMPLTPNNTGGTITNYVVTPDLPAGLSLDPVTGIISGTPTTVTQQETYVIIGRNNAGYVTVGLNLVVDTNVEPPTGLKYAGCTICTFTVGDSIVPLRPNSSGGQITNYTISPALPDGLSLDPITGVITGTPSTETSQITYAITGVNIAGVTITGFVLTTQTLLLPPILFFYFDSSYELVTGAPIIPIVPVSFGGQITNCVVSPALPPGLSLNAITCVINGMPAKSISPVLYTVTAGNDAGNISTGLTLVVKDQLAAPNNLDYGGTQFTFTVNLPITTLLVPQNGGGQIASYSVSPALPAGVSLNTSNGEISGKPTVLSSAAPYTITGTNDTGSTQTTISLSVQNLQQGCLDPACDIYYHHGLTWTRLTTTTYNYLEAKNYCENTITNLLGGGLWELPGNFHLLFGWRRSLDVQNVLDKGWTTGLVWVEPSDKSQIGSFTFGVTPIVPGAFVAPLPPETRLLVTCVREGVG